MEKQIPVKCVGFIMDGNRRWAKAHGLDTVEGHTHGYEALKRVIDVVYARGIPHMVCYAFSTENWKRPEREVATLMHIFRHGFEELAKTMNENGKKIRVRFIGDRSRFDNELQESMQRAEAQQCDEPTLTLWVALSYGGRAEIVEAANRAIALGTPVTEESFAALLSTAGMPDPDLIIRTSGEQRLSNFLLWQSAYSEFFFTDTYWPDFGEAEFRGILEQYANRERRNGV